MLLIIRQPLGAAALLGLLGSGLWGAEVLACAQLQAQLTGQIAWMSPWSADDADPDEQPCGDGSRDFARDGNSSQSELAVGSGGEVAARNTSLRRKPRHTGLAAHTYWALGQFGNIFGVSYSGDTFGPQSAFCEPVCSVGSRVVPLGPVGVALPAAGVLAANCPVVVALYGSGAELG